MSQNYMSCLLAQKYFCAAVLTYFCLFFLSSLTKDESKRPKYKELLVSSWTVFHRRLTSQYLRSNAQACYECGVHGSEKVD